MTAILFVQVLLILFLFIIALLYFFGFIAEFLGAPYVATSSKITNQILDKANLKHGQLFIELGSGDGRVVRTAVKKYGVTGVGVDCNPILVLYARFLAKLQRLSDITFINKNLFDTSLQKADVIFLFLLPRIFKKLENKIKTECKPGTLIISHGFKIQGLNSYLIETTPRFAFSTYYYQLP